MTTVLATRKLGLATAHQAPARLTLQQLADLPDGAAIEAVKRGLPAPLARQLSDRLELSLDALAPPLQLTLRTLHRRIQQGTFAQGESERLLALVRVFFQAAEVLGTEAKASHWLKGRIRALSGKTPLECMETWLGIRQVEGILWRIRDGVYS